MNEGKLADFHELHLEKNNNYFQLKIEIKQQPVFLLFHTWS